MADDLPPPQPQSPTQNRTPRFDRSDLIAVIALSISILGATATLWQTTIFREQLALAAEQKGAEVWPLVDVNTVFNHDDSLRRYTYRLEIENTGVGPALIGSLRFTYAGTPFATDRFAETIAAGRGGFGQTFSRTVHNTVLPAGRKLTMFDAHVSKDSLTFREFTDLVAEVDKVEVSICYCSVYRECWEYRRDEWPLRVDGCEGLAEL